MLAHSRGPLLAHLPSGDKAVTEPDVFAPDALMHIGAQEEDTELRVHDDLRCERTGAGVESDSGLHRHVLDVLAIFVAELRIEAQYDKVCRCAAEGVGSLAHEGCVGDPGSQRAPAV